MYTSPCPCGDLFAISVDDLLDGEDLADCPSCSLLLRVTYDPEAFLASIEASEAAREAGEEEEVPGVVEKEEGVEHDLAAAAPSSSLDLSSS